MTTAGTKIIEGLKEAIAGSFAAVTIEGQRWVRVEHDMTPDERLEAAARASYEQASKQLIPSRLGEIAWEDLHSVSRHAWLWSAAAALAAAYPELSAGTHWLAPMEMTEGMREAWYATRQLDPGCDGATTWWHRSRDAYLKEGNKP